uniref:G-protein coupled receptors family 1 profile domain-containing protein n=1 Tax=Plectus sambesii TaxID=2011161 RepID=A0A914W909_9BILA
MEEQQRPVAVYLGVTGGMAVVFNLVGLLPFVRFRKRTLHGSPSALPLFAILLIDLFIAAVQIFPTVTAASGRWLYSEAGCTAYAAVELYLSGAQISMVTFIALDRYLITCAPTWESWRSVVNYQKTLFFFGSVGALWCTLPMIGWGSYVPSPSRVACTIDWSRTDHAYVSFLTGTFLLLFLVPFCSAAALYYSTYEFVKRANSAEARDE